MRELRRVEPFRLMMKDGCARNDFGPLIFFLFWVQNPLNNAEPFAMWDCYLDPKNEVQLRLWRMLAAQTHWHVFLVGEGGQQENFFKFVNSYGLHEALALFDEACRGIATVDFDRAKQVFMDEKTIDDLFRLR